MAARATTYAQALLDSWERAPEDERGALLDRFVTLLRSERVLSLGPSILEAVERLVTERRRRQTATVTFARRANEETQQWFAQRFGEVTRREDPSLLGGFRLRREGRFIDASVSDALTQLRRTMVSE